MSMLLYEKPIFTSLTICLLMLVSACANNKELEKNLAPDPQLKNNPAFSQLIPTPTQNSQQAEQLKADSTSEISSEPPSPPVILTSPPIPELETQPSPTPLLPTPVPTDDIPPVSTPTPLESLVWKKALKDVPVGLHQYIADVSKLGVFQKETKNQDNQQDTTTLLVKPQNIVSRRIYARWLVNANNKIFANNPAKQIRLAGQNETPIFEDVPQTDPDFTVIQGLAEAGIIPSPLSGNTNIVKFRPDDSLTREDLILWKVPLDFRKSLPEATVEQVEEAWDFQDASKIDPTALRAVLADAENEDLSNIRRVFGYTRLFRPDKTVSLAEAAAVLWYFGDQKDGKSAQMALPKS